MTTETIDIAPELRDRRAAIYEVIDLFETQKEFCKALDLGESRVSRALSDKTISSRRLAPIERAIDRWQQSQSKGGDGAREEVRQSPAPIEQVEHARSDANGELLTYSFLSGGPEAGTGGVQHDQGEVITVPRGVAAQWGQGRVLDPDRAYWTRVQGESMEPWLPDQTPIFVEELREFRDGGRYVVWVGDVEANVVKRVERLSEEMILLISDNGSFPNRRLTHQKGNTYKDKENDETVTLRVRGRVVFPPDTGHSITKTVTDEIGKVLREQAAG